MESSSLFNPGFLGGSFYWFIGQIADDSTWRENQNPNKFEEVSEMPAWGYSCLLYTSPSPRDRVRSRMPSSA